MLSLTKLDVLFYDFFYDLLWFFKDSVKINKKEKDKIVFKIVDNWAKEVKRIVSKVKGGGLPGFRV
jgi:hypothetical protein